MNTASGFRLQVSGGSGSGLPPGRMASRCMS
jgi:hypothetical protein